MSVRPTALAAALFATLATAPVAAQKAPPAACADFYTHVNAAWLAQNPLPPGTSHFSRWDQINPIALQQRDLMIAATTAPAGARVSTHLADLFASHAALPWV